MRFFLLLYISNSLDISSVVNCLISISNVKITLTRSHVVNIRAKNRFAENRFGAWNCLERTMVQRHACWSRAWERERERERKRTCLSSSSQPRTPRSAAQRSVQQRYAWSCMVVHCTHVQLHSHIAGSYHHTDHTDHTACNPFSPATSYARRESMREPRGCLLRWKAD